MIDLVVIRYIFTHSLVSPTAVRRKDRILLLYVRVNIDCARVDFIFQFNI